MCIGSARGSKSSSTTRTTALPNGSVNANIGTTPMPAPDMLAALREGRLLNDAKLQALRVFEAQMTRERSWLSHAELQAFYDAVLARYGGRRIARGGQVVILEGPAETRRVVIAEFADFDSAERCYRSPEYQAIIAYRKGCATFEFILVDGVPG